MTQVTSYVKRKGDSDTSASKEDVGAQDKWNKAKGAITNDNPPVLFIHDDGIGVGNHYVAVEAVRKDPAGLVDALGYYANFGNGGNPKWIYDLDGEPDYSILDAIVLDKVRNPIKYSNWYPGAVL